MGTAVLTLAMPCNGNGFQFGALFHLLSRYLPIDNPGNRGDTLCSGQATINRGLSLFRGFIKGKRRDFQHVIALTTVKRVFETIFFSSSVDDTVKVVLWDERRQSFQILLFLSAGFSSVNTRSSLWMTFLRTDPRLFCIMMYEVWCSRKANEQHYALST